MAGRALPDVALPGPDCESFDCPGVLVLVELCCDFWPLRMEEAGTFRCSSAEVEACSPGAVSDTPLEDVPGVAYPEQDLVGAGRQRWRVNEVLGGVELSGEFRVGRGEVVDSRDDESVAAERALRPVGGTVGGSREVLVIGGALPVEAGG